MGKKVSVKENLKIAKQAITDEDWKAASKACSSALKQDATSYMAWVLMGLAMAHVDMEKAIKSYQKATVLQPTQATAWQGLAKLFTELPEPSLAQLDQLCEALKAITKECLPSDHPKQYEFQHQLAEVFTKLNQHVSAISTYTSLIQHEGTQDNTETFQNISNIVIESVSLSKKAGEAESKIGDACIEYIRHIKHEETREKYAKEFLDEVKKIGNVEEISRVSMVLLDIVPYLYDPIEFITHLIQTDEYLDGRKQVAESSADLLIKLKTYFPRKPLTAVYEAISLNEKKEKEAEVLSLLRNNVAASNYPFAWFVLAQRYAACDASLLFDTVKKGMKSIKDLTEKNPFLDFTSLRADMLLLMGKGYEKNKKMKEAIKIFYIVRDLVRERKPHQFLLLSRTLARLEYEASNYDTSFVLFTEILETSPEDEWALYYTALIYYEKKEYMLAKLHIEKAMIQSKGSALYYYWAAEIYWKLEGMYRSDKKFTLTHLLRSAKLDGKLSCVFASLGRYYQEEGNDVAKAQKCYQKSLLLDPYNDISSRNLCDLFLSEGKTGEAVTIYTKVLEQRTGVDWAWKALGIHYLETGYHNEALTCFQSVLRNNAEDLECLQGLGQAYCHQGMHMAALRVFSKLIEKNPEDPAILYRLGNIQFAIGMYDDAIRFYDDYLVYGGDITEVVSFEMAQCYLYRAQEEIQEGLFSRASISLSNAISFIGLCKEITIGFYKLQGDIYSMCFSLPENLLSEMTFPTLPTPPNPPLFPSSKVQWIIKGRESYLAGIEIEENAYLLYDVGVNYWKQSQLDTTSKEERKHSITAAKKYFKAAIMICPSEIKFWNGIGSVEENAALKQHFFIRALHIDATSAETWCNLMVLYMEYGHYEMARECHERVITFDPELPRVWTCYALLKELEGEKEGTLYDNSNVSQYEAFYRFAWENNPNSLFVKQSLAYHSTDPHFATFALQKCVEQKPNDISSWNLLGVLQEQIGEFSLAASSFQRAASLLEVLPLYDESTVFSSSMEEWKEEKRFNMNINTTPPHALYKVYLNWARCLCKSFQYKEALYLYEKMVGRKKKDLLEQTSFYALSLLRSSNSSAALSLLLQQYKNHPEEYQFLHHWSRFAAEGKTGELAITQLLASKTKENVETLRVLSALAIHMERKEASGFLASLHAHPDASSDDIKMEISFFIQRGEKEAAKKAFTKAIHLEPWNSTLRALYASFLSYFFVSDPKQMYQAMQQVCNGCGGVRDDLSWHWNCISRCLILVGKQGLENGFDLLLRAKAAVQHAIHYDPTSVYPRYQASVVAYSMGMIKGSLEQIQCSIQMMQRTIAFLTASSSSSSVAPWMLSHCYIMLAEIQIMAGASKDALTTLDKNPATNISEQRTCLLRTRCAYLLDNNNSKEMDMERMDVEMSSVFDILDAFATTERKEEKNLLGIEKMYEILLERESLVYSERLLVLLSAALFHYRNGNYAAALLKVDAGHRFSGRRSDVFCLLKGAIHIALKEWKNAGQILQRASNINSNIPLLHFLVAQVHVHSREWEDAFIHAEKELESNPLFTSASTLMDFIVKHKN